MRSLATSHTTSLYVMPEVLNRASSVFLDSPVKPWNDKNVVLLMNSLVTSTLACRFCLQILRENYFLKEIIRKRGLCQETRPHYMPSNLFKWYNLSNKGGNDDIRCPCWLQKIEALRAIAI